MNGIAGAFRLRSMSTPRMIVVSKYSFLIIPNGLRFNDE